MHSKHPLRIIDRLVLPIDHISRSTYLKVTLGVFLLLALATRHPLDPSPLNLLVPANGIHNLMMLPGALIAGFLTDSIGLTAYIIPLSLLLFAKKGKKIKPLRFIPVTIAIMAFATLLSLLIKDSPETLMEVTGIWGVNARSALIIFPGLIPSLLILSAYLIMFSREIRIDSTPILLISFLAMLTMGIVKRVKTGIATAYLAVSKYFNINWLTPGLTYFEKNLGLLGKTTRSRLDRFRNHLQEIRQKKQPVVSKNPSGLTPSTSTFIDEDELLSQTILEYRKQLFVLDSRDFLVYEEEI